MSDGLPPAAILRDAGIAMLPEGMLPVAMRPREGRAWLVDWQGTRAVLRQLPASSASDLQEDVCWLHGFLTSLAALGFCSPWPLPCFGGRSWTTGADGLVYEIVSYLPGDTVGWAAVPPMEEIGALLGRYHAAARQVRVCGQRPSALPLAEVPGILLSGRLESAGVDPERAAAIRSLAAALADDLAAARGQASDPLVIHGDFTNHNVLAAGHPARPTGVIDFALAHQETPLADIGYGLWRSGRPRQEADYLDLARVQRFVSGYARVSPLSAQAATVIALYLRGRGLQMIAKRVRAGRQETGMLAQVQWLSAHARALDDAIAAALA